MSSSRKQSVAAAGIVGAAILLGYLGAVAVEGRHVARLPTNDTAVIPRAHPLRFEPTADFTDLVDRDRLGVLLRQVVPRWDSYRSSNILHALRLWGASFEPHGLEELHSKYFPFFPSGQQMLSCTLDATSTEWLSGGSEPLLFDSPYGVSVRGPGKTGGTDTGLAHVDQVIALLGEMGVASSTALRTAAGTTRTVRDVIADSVARFHPSQELEWTTVAYCYWLPPQSSWVNRFGRRTTFDDLADALMQRPLGSGACGGVHVPYALSILLRADSEHPILRRATRTRIERWFAHLRELLEHNQYRNGAWSSDWADQTVRGTSRELGYESLVTTGHHLEWIALAPPQCRPNRRSVNGAVQYLFAYLPHHEASTVSWSYGPFSHAARALTLLANADPNSVLRRYSLDGDEP